MSDEMSAPWPQDGDQLFIQGDDWYHNALLHIFSQKGDVQAETRELDLYIRGYKEGGDRLVQASMEDRAYQDMLVYPIIFLYRQYLELSLKRLIRKEYRLLETPSPYQPVGFPITHDLLELWRVCTGLLQEMNAAFEDMQVPSQDLAIISDLLVQFVEQDPDSYAFRYPTNRRNAPSFPDLYVINVRSLAEVMEKLANFFDGAAMAISAHWDLRQEFRRYLEAEGEQNTEFN